MYLFKNNILLVFIFFLILIFGVFRNLFFSYFEADEWYHFTYYFPLTKQPDGLVTAIKSTFIDSGVLSGGQHVVPVASAVYFLNSLFFGLNYQPYAFMTLLLHSVNTFLIFLLMRLLLKKQKDRIKNIFAFISALFFAFAPTPTHAITGAAPFYGQNVLSVTFFISCLIFFKNGFITKQKKYLYMSVIFLFLSLFTKETAVFLFVLLPLFALIEKRVFSFKFLGKLFIFCMVFYFVLRFIIPNIYSTHDSLQTVQDNKTIVSNDGTIYKNIYSEVAMRSALFPLRMMGTLFLPRETTLSIVQFITPVIVPIPPDGDRTNQLVFIYGAGNYMIIYLSAVCLFVFFGFQIKKFYKSKQLEDMRAVILGVSIIVLSAVPLVAIVFSFPRWGYDFYFDSRFYYNPNVGAAILFPFLLFAVAEFIASFTGRRLVIPITIVLFILWALYNFSVLSITLNQFIGRYSSDRREVSEQIISLLPALKERTVFYVETNEKSAYGPSLPFQTNIPQAISLIYFQRNGLPDSFFDKTILDGKPEGYQYADGRGFGYYTSKKSLANDLKAEKFKIDDVYAYYYYADKVKLVDTSSSLRKEMQNYIQQ